jgi:hypothetical protein
MKTLKLNTKKSFFSLFFTLSLVLAGCGTSTSGGTYTWSNGVCYTNTGVVVANTYCTSSTSTYTVYNGFCYTSTGQNVAMSYCTTAVTPTTGGSCVGNYYYLNNGTYQLVYCNGADCRGYSLVSATTNQTVMCQ